ncbi:MAG: DUF1559 domain-containing protein, partial [Isosphaeraceae bacterium]
LICPSESVTQGPWRMNNSNAKSWTNYRGNFGGPPSVTAFSGTIVPMRNDSQGTPNGYPANSAYNNNCGIISLASVTDGTSSTAVVSERLAGVYTAGLTQITPGSIQARRVMFQTPVTVNLNSGNGAQALQFTQQCQNLPGTTPPLSPSWSGACWAGGHTGTFEFNGYSHVIPPNGNSCGAAPPGSGVDGITATSNHSGGVNLAFLDGSVHFIKSTVAPNIWWALGTRSQGEVISSDAY